MADNKVMNAQGDFNSLATFDESVLEPLHELQVEGEPSFVGGLIRDYLTQIEELNEKVQTAEAEGDSSSMEKVAHKLKSSSAVLGLVKLAGICSSIEEGARAKQKTRTQVHAFATETLKVVEILKAYLSKIGA